MNSNSNQCPADVVEQLKRVDWNKMEGTADPVGTFEQFMKCVPRDEVNKILLAQNKVFVDSILNDIYTKNKIDYPPFGPTNMMKQTYQSAKITEILRGLLDKQKTKDTKYHFGTLDMTNMLESGFGTVGAWINNTARGVGRTVSQPRQTLSSTGRSLKHMFGLNREPEYGNGTYYKGGKRSYRKTRRHTRKA
jgi:hypothetical protein